ncbi:hypothetical protein [Cellulomonas marina]|uniref:Uncharacterized protein n=1 Tax=Cellulomonas marina TaxID=988821 RepID=A0A1I0ZHZ7_9CELL|nr:hypothetical protein [Cellulomonas marina]GIG28578.1 hypothetical protein Cma02nite_11780 [Cellulomonas marina]SFB24992.1 hypothetical protein SAMN05421867_11165 [Cellulomonas marina]
MSGPLLDAAVRLSLATTRTAAGATPTPGPSPSTAVELGESDLGSPGFLGFVVTFVLALAVIGLLLSLTRKLRRVNHAGEQRDAEDRAPGAPGPS